MSLLAQQAVLMGKRFVITLTTETTNYSQDLIQSIGFIIIFQAFDVLISELGSLPVSSLLEEVKRLQNIAYQLGLEERKEMTRGKYLNILKRRHQQ